MYEKHFWWNINKASATEVNGLWQKQKHILGWPFQLHTIYTILPDSPEQFSVLDMAEFLFFQLHVVVLQAENAGVRSSSAFWN